MAFERVVVRSATLRCVISSAVLLCAFGTSAATIEVQDRDFSSWSSFSFVTDDPNVSTPGPGTSAGTATRVAAGGNPGAFLNIVHTVKFGDTIWTGGIKSDYTYNPAVQGAISALSLGANVRMPGPGASAWEMVVQQGGQRYYSYPFGAFSGSSWSGVTASNLTAANFDTNPWAGNGGVSPDGRHPDFSSTGAPLQFGFLVGNGLGGPGTLSVPHGLDNFALTLNVTPSPPDPFTRIVDPCSLAVWCADHYTESFDGSALTISMTLGVRGSPTEELQNNWAEGIEKYWGSEISGERFSIVDSSDRYPIYFDVNFVDGALPADFIISVVDGVGRTETSTWYTTLAGWGNDFQDEAAAHEFGHYLGLYDEYKGGTLEPFGPGWLCDSSKPLSDPVNASCDGLMGDLRLPTLDRYYEDFLADFAEFTGRSVVLAGSPFPP